MSRRDPGTVNAATFNRPDVLSTYPTGWTDLGERRAMGHVAEVVRGGAILDIGIGTGRTTRLLRKRVSEDYVGIDFADNSLAIARRKLPDVDIRFGDARDLHEFGDTSKDLVVFSFNGIDAVGHRDRGRVLDEMIRVLRPGGRLWYSSLNLDSWYARSRPWLIGVDGLPLKVRPKQTGHWLAGVPGNLPRYARTYRNWARLRGSAVEGHGWAVRPLQVHDFGVLSHYTTVWALREELRTRGMIVDEVLASSGDVVEPGSGHSDAPYLHVIAHHAEGAP